MTRKLDVFLRAARAGLLEQDDAANLTFTYDEDYLASESARAISVSMPLVAAPYTNAVAKPYFSGLLPDESARTRIAAALGVSDTNAYGMLEIIGGDCAGALALFPVGADTLPQKSLDEILDQQQLGELLRELRGNPLLGSRKDVRLSLAGAQDKIAVRVTDDQIALVKRFDRLMLRNQSVQRLHQEDFCQALSIPPELKYEDEGGPGIQKSLDLLQRVVDQPAADRLAFLRMQVFHYLVGNADAHAKNYALLHTSDTDSPVLAPLYDIVCTAIYPQLTKKIAMRIGGRNIPDTIQRNHWLSMVPDTMGSHNLLTRELTTLASKIIPAMERLLADADELGISHPVLHDIGNVIRTRSQLIMRGLS